MAGYEIQGYLQPKYIDYNKNQYGLFNEKFGLRKPTHKQLWVTKPATQPNIKANEMIYQYRIDAAVKLFKAGKIKFILISGDNSKEHYNEPESMKNDLLAAGIPASNIVLDYAVFRMLDSLLRCKIVFGTTDITIISQEFHN
jgi:hypothetical protein